MDEKQLQLHLTQQKILKNEISDLKLSVLNKFDDISCWSDSQRMRNDKTNQNSLHNLEDQDMLYQNNQDLLKQNQETKNKNYNMEILQLSNYPMISEDKSSKNDGNLIRICRTMNDNSFLEMSNSNIKMSQSKPNDSFHLKELNSQDQDYILKQKIKKTQKCLVAISSTAVHRQSVINFPLLMKIRKRLSHFFRKYTLSGRSLLLNKNARIKINDLSDGHSEKSGGNLCKRILSYIPFQNKLSSISQVSMLQNFDNFGLFTKSLFTLFNLFFLYIFSLIVVFLGEENIIKRLLLIAVPIWIIEIIIKMNTLSYKTVNAPKKRKMSFIKYLKHESFFDIVPIIMILIPTGQQEAYNILFNLLVLLKFFNVIEDLQEIQRRLCMMIKKYYFIQLINLIMQLFTIGHVVSCLWYLLSLLETDYYDVPDAWKNGLPPEDQVWWRLYIWSLYWSLTLMTTGSNQAKTIAQASFTSFNMLFTTITFGYFVNAIGIILSEIDEQYQTQRKDMSLINQYMRKRNISQQLQQQVNLDLMYYYKKNYQKIQEDNNLVLGKISTELQKSLKKQYIIQVLNRISFLQKNFSLKSLEELSLQIKEEFFFPNQMIMNENESDGSVLYIISGQVELFSSFYKEHNLSIPVQQVKKGEITGEFNFFTGMHQTPNIRSSDFTKVLRIQRSCFINILKGKDKDYEQFCQIKDKILQLGDQSDIVKLCSVCSKQNHSCSQCPLVSIDRDISNFKVTLQQKEKQKRSPFQRKVLKKSNCLYDLSFHKIQVKSLQNQIRMIDQNAKSYQRLEIQYTSDEDLECEDKGTTGHEDNGELNKKFTQEDITQLRSQYKIDPFSTSNGTVIDQSVKVQKFQKCSSKLQSSSQDEEFEDLSPLSPPQEKQKSLKNSLAFDHQQQIDQTSIDSSKRKINYEMLKRNSKEYSEIEMQQKKNYKLNSVRRSSSSRSNFFIQLSLQEDAQQTKQSPPIIERKPTSAHVNKNEFRATTQKEISYLSALQNQLIPAFSLNDIQIFSPWVFDKQQDYKYYFITGNSKLKIARYNKFIRKNFKTLKKKQKKKVAV